MGKIIMVAIKNIKSFVKLVQVPKSEVPGVGGTNCPGI